MPISVNFFTHTGIESIVEHNTSSLVLASQNSDLEQVNPLLRDPKQHSQQEIVAALLSASQNGHGDIVKVIISHCNQDLVDYTDSDGHSALIVASQHGHEEVVEILLGHGARVDVSDENGTTSVMAASRNGHYNVVKLLLSHNAHVSEDFIATLPSDSAEHSTIISMLKGRLLEDGKSHDCTFSLAPQVS